MRNQPRRLAVLAQYDPQGGLPPHVRIHLQGLRPVAERIVLVSNSPLSAEARATAEGLCDRILERENKGYDFAAWRDVLATEETADWDWIVLTNSSVIGPLFPLAPIMERMEVRGADFWGMVRSREGKAHFQSFFLAFSRSVLTSASWASFWNEIKEDASKQYVIQSYELALASFFEGAGFRSDQLVNDVGLARRIRLVPTRRMPVPWRPIINRSNPSLNSPLRLVLQGMPYLKASLFWGADTFRRTPLKRIKNLPEVVYCWDEIGL